MSLWAFRASSGSEEEFSLSAAHAGHKNSLELPLINIHTGSVDQEKPPNTPNSAVW